MVNGIRLWANDVDGNRVYPQKDHGRFVLVSRSSQRLLVDTATEALDRVRDGWMLLMDGEIPVSTSRLQPKFLFLPGALKVDGVLARQYSTTKSAFDGLAAFVNRRTGQILPVWTEQYKGDDHDPAELKRNLEIVAKHAEEWTVLPYADFDIVADPAERKLKHNEWIIDFLYKNDLIVELVDPDLHLGTNQQ